MVHDDIYVQFLLFLTFLGFGKIEYNPQEAKNIARIIIKCSAEWVRLLYPA